jgi:hypothetical protein
MDIKNKAIDDGALNEVSGGQGSTILRSGGSNRSTQLVYNCVGCGKKFNSLEDLQAHQTATGHTGHGERYE